MKTRLLSLVLAAALCLTGSAPCVAAIRVAATSRGAGIPFIPLVVPNASHVGSSPLPLALTSLSFSPTPLLSGPSLLSKSASVVPIASVPEAFVSPAVLPGAVLPAAQAEWQERHGLTPELTAAKLTQDFTALKAAFGDKKSESLEGGVEAQGYDGQGKGHLTAASESKDTVNDGDGKPPVPPNSAPRRSRSGFSRGILMFLAALGVAQVGLESQAAGIPPLIAKVFGDVTISAQLGIYSSLAEIAGSIMAPPIIKRLGLKKTYLGTTALRLVSGALLAGLLATGYMTMPVLMVVYSVESFLMGITCTAEKIIPAVMLEQHQGKLERFKAVRQLLVESVATIVPIATGALVASLGFLPALIAFPLSAGLSIAIVAMTLKLPQKIKDVSALPEPAARAEAGPGFRASTRDFFHNIGRGTKAVFKSPALLTSFLAYSVYQVLSPLLYWIIAPAFGILMAGAGHEGRAAAVSGMMTGLYSLGGLIAGVLIMGESRRLEKLKATGLTAAGEKEALRRSMLRWMLWGTLGLAGVATMALPLSALIGALTVPALGLLVFGIAQVMAKLKLESYFQSQSPSDKVDDTSAFLEAGSMVLTTAALVAANWLFRAFAGFTPFYWIAGAMVPLALLCLVLRKRLDKVSK